MLQVRRLYTLGIVLCLCLLHQMFLHATERVSQSDVPLLHEVIPIIDILTAKLVDTISDFKLPTQIRFAAALGYEVINKYYSATDESIMYRCAMGEWLYLFIVALWLTNSLQLSVTSQI